MKNADCQVNADEMFFAQLEEFCRLVQQEFLARFSEVKEISTSTEHALTFAETLMLCPTQDSAQMCIQRELTAALSFVIAIQALQRQLDAGHFKLTSEVPDYQTRFYLLASTIRDFLQMLHPQLAPTKP